MFLRLVTLSALCLASLALAGNALASGGNYAFAGGSPAERANVKAALDASAFPWGVVPKQITIHIGRGFPSDASRGNVWLDAGLLDSGRLAWGTIQHEYAHQVDYFLLDDGLRTRLAPLLRGKSWWPRPGLAHYDVTSERFASTLAWSYWPDAANTMRPEGAGSESAAMAPAKFRALLAQVLHVADPLATVQQANAKPAQPKTAAKRHAVKRRKARKPKRSTLSVARRNRR